MAQVISRRSIIYDILFDVEKGKRSAKDAEKALGDIEKKATGLGGTFTNLGKQIAGAFAVQQVTQQLIQFTKEAFQLGLKAEGVRKAFNALNNPNLLSNLRTATKGAVDDLTLMQASVRADKFKIPLDTLAKLFKFAAQRARETGQEVGFLTDSIIDGIGRKSPLILDNLGLRAQDLQDEFKKTGDFAQAAANVISREMQDSGKDIEGNADKVARLATSWQNLKVEVGSALVELSGPVLDGINKQVGILKTLIDPAGRARAELEKIAAAQRELIAQSNAAGAAIFGRLFNQTLDTTEFSLAEIQQRLTELNTEFAETTDPQKRMELAQMILRFQEMEAAIKKLLEPAKELNEAIQFDPKLYEKQQKELFDTLQGISDFIAKTKGDKDFNIAPTIDNSELIKYGEELLRQQNQTATFGEVVRDNAQTIGDSFSQINTALLQLASEGSKAQIAFAGVQIFVNQARAISGAIAAATEAAGATGGLSLPVLIPSFVAIALSTFAQVHSLLNQAKSAQAETQAFAEGEVDIHRSGERRGKDSIPAVIMPGETVTTTEKTRRYKPYLQAIHDGSLEDLIRVNHIEPALALNALEQSQKDSTLIDYSDKFYRQFQATGEGNLNGKRMVRLLHSIDRKLSSNKSRFTH